VARKENKEHHFSTKIRTKKTQSGIFVIIGHLFLRRNAPGSKRDRGQKTRIERSIKLRYVGKSSVQEIKEPPVLGELQHLTRKEGRGGSEPERQRYALILPERPLLQPGRGSPVIKEDESEHRNSPQGTTEKKNESKANSEDAATGKDCSSAINSDSEGEGISQGKGPPNSK